MHCFYVKLVLIEEKFTGTKSLCPFVFDGFFY